ncbi:MAG TPA: type II CAAX endopeptidase family protein [Candidatus Solibacter sp.]|nr:type II CAAX endopeptidase family protein [Candidatus Solibacter sp.]
MEENSAEVAPEFSFQRFEPVAAVAHTVSLLLILAAVAAVGYASIHRQASVPRQNRMVFYLITMAWEWILFLFIYWGLRRRGKSFRDIAGVRWKNARDFFRDLGIAFGFWIAAIAILSLIASVLRAKGMAEAARMLAPRGFLESILWVALAITAGICEETIFRGYLQRQFVAWTRNAPVGVLLSAALFGAGHIYQGGKATIVIAVYGLMFGILAEVRQNLRPGMMVHAWHDAITGLLIRFAPVK